MLRGIDSTLESLYSLPMKSLSCTKDDAIVEGCKIDGELRRAPYQFYVEEISYQNLEMKSSKEEIGN